MQRHLTKIAALMALTLTGASLLPGGLGFAPATAQTALPPSGKQLVIDRMFLVERPATSYRDPALKPATSVPTDRELLIYAEPTSMATKFENGEVKALFIIDLQLKNPAGKVIRDGKGALRVPLSVKSTTNAPLNNVYVNVTLNALRLPPGTYDLLVRFNDNFGRSSAEKTIKVVLTAPVGGAPPAKK